ncbi:MAG: class I SAM-dependent methyltransferase [Desulfamplus sp.]|nr:class I SAM-dependent methyltransferase [Desulfamplus sp.]
MLTNYDKIAQECDDARDVIFIKYADDYMHFKLIGDLSDKTILDIGCGTGSHTRAFRHLGAKKVVGIDYFKEMITIAEKKELSNPLNIEYFQQNIFEPFSIGLFDIVTAFSVISIASSQEELTVLFKSVYNNLLNGGRFIIAGLNPELSPSAYQKCEKYGFKVTCESPQIEGAIITSTLKINNNDVKFEDYYFKIDTYFHCLRNAGFTTINMHLPEISPEGIDKFGKEFWQDFITEKMQLYIECKKTSALG